MTQLIFSGARWLVAAILMPACVGSSAQIYPSKPIRMVVGFSTGGGPDIVGRLIAPKMAEILGQQVVVDNRPGAGGSIAEEIVVKAPPDGYTILACSNSLSINPSLYKNLPYVPLRDLAPVSLTGISAQMLVVARAIQAKSVDEVIALAKAKPGQLTYGSSGNGSGSHLSGELFKVMTGVQITHVPYKGGGQGVVALLSGDVSMMFAAAAPALPFVTSGRMRALAVTTAKRMAAAPDVPTMDEAGVKGYESFPWYGVLAPAGTPKPIIDRLNAAVVAAVQAPELKDRYAALGVEPASGTPAEFRRFTETELKKWAQVVRQGALRAD